MGSIRIGTESFEIVSQIDNISIVDSFVMKNKVGIGSGEARLYLGSQNNGQYNYSEFFNGFIPKAFFLKSDLNSYLDDAKIEYEKQEQGYVKDIAADWAKYKASLDELSEKEFFTIYPVIGEKDSLRYYIRSDDSIWGLFRKIMLPSISFLTIFKVKDNMNNYFFLFKPILNYFYNKNNHPYRLNQEVKKIEGNKSISKNEKKQLVQARIGQGKYRRDLLEEKTECLITKVNDERLLIASHIKPWADCNDIEKIDHYNGLALTPTYDKMFDQGFISFKNDGTIIISPYISPLNLRKLNLIPNKKYEIINISKRTVYLEYHRKNILKI